ncbi:MAG: hypothetical protein V1790_00945 [Planctomycetota bacterium]
MSARKTDPLLTHFLENAGFIGRFREIHKKGMNHKPMPCSHLRSTAGDRIRTGDVQLGKTLFGLDRLASKAFVFSILA